MKDCLFCKFAKGEIKPEIVYENEHVLAFLDINPSGKLCGHTLVISKKHFETIEDIDEKELCEVIKAVKKIARAVKIASGATGINLWQNNYASAGQLIPHFHFHIVPRIKEDGIMLESQRTKPPAEDLKETAEKIRGQLWKSTNFRTFFKII